MERNREAPTAPRRKLPRTYKSQPVSDQQFEERQRIAEQLVQTLREAGYSCDIGDCRDC
jgi:hypothetical protein